MINLAFIAIHYSIIAFMQQNYSLQFQWLNPDPKQTDFMMEKYLKTKIRQKLF